MHTLTIAIMVKLKYNTTLHSALSLPNGQNCFLMDLTSKIIALPKKKRNNEINIIPKGKMFFVNEYSVLNWRPCFEYNYCHKTFIILFATLR